jgi:glycosyltransferase involved in cell wall biosynthesis
LCKARGVPEEPAATAAAPRLSVALDATPLLGRPTGVGVFCAGALAALACDPTLDVSAFAVTWRRRGWLDDRLPVGVAHHQRPMPARPLHAAWARSDRPPLEWFVGRPDVVHGTNFVVPPTRRAARVVTVHDLSIVLYPDLVDASTLAYPGLIRRAVDGGAWIHALSHFVAAQIVEEFGVPAERVRAVHLGVPVIAPPTPQTPQTPGPAAVPAGLPPGCDRYVLAIGTIEPRKDYASLVAAFGALPARHRDVALVIVGGEGWGAAEVASAVAASPARERVVRTGYLDDPALTSVLGGATALAYPSRYEGFGFPPLQAMAAGVPVVTTTAGAIPEVVGDGAVLVPPGDAEALAGALADVLDGRDVDALVARGRSRAAAFTWEACGAGLADLYRAAAADRGRR